MPALVIPMTTTPTSPRRRRAQPRAQARDSEPSTERARAEHEVWGWWAQPQAQRAEDGDRGSAARLRGSGAAKLTAVLLELVGPSTWLAACSSLWLRGAFAAFDGVLRPALRNLPTGWGKT